MSDFKYHRPSNFPPVVKNLIIINVLIFIGQLTITGLTERFMLYPILPHGLEKYMASSEEGYYGFHPYQIFTHMFSHSPTFFFHIIFNMLVLWMFGRVLENIWGPKRFLFFYIICGLGAAALHLGVQYFRAEQLWQAVQSGDQAGIPKYRGALGGALGASGAIMGIMAAFAYLFPNTELFFNSVSISYQSQMACIGIRGV